MATYKIIEWCEGIGDQVTQTGLDKKAAEAKVKRGNNFAKSYGVSERINYRLEEEK